MTRLGKLLIGTISVWCCLQLRARAVWAAAKNALFPDAVFSQLRFRSARD